MELLEIYKQSQIHKTISQDVKSGMLNHCYMLCTADEFILNVYAFFVAKEICCLVENSPCGVCNNCLKIDHENMVDLCVFPKTEKNLVVEDINNIVTDCYIRPVENNYKIYILKNFDLCTVQAQNKILKTLEEPPANVVFILTCMSENQVLPTISSRSKKILEPLLNKDIIEKYLEEKKVQNFKTISSMSAGNLGVALNLSKNSGALEIVDLIFDMLKNMRVSSDILKYSSKILSYKKDITFLLDSLVSVLRDVAVCNSRELINFSDREKDLLEISKNYNKKVIEKIIKLVCDINNKIDFNCNMTGLIDKLLLDILEVKFICQ